MNSLTVTRNILDVISETIMYSIVLMTLNYLYIRQPVGPILVGMLIASVAVIHIIRDRTTKKRILICFGVLLVVITVALPISVLHNMLLIFFVFVEVVLAYGFVDSKDITPKVKDKIPFFGGVVAFAFIFCRHMKDASFNSSLTVAVVGLVIVVAAQHYCDGMVDYITCSKEYRGISIKSMIGANTITMLSVAVIMALVVAIGSFSRILERIASTLAKLIQYLAGHVNLEKGKYVSSVSDNDIPKTYDGKLPNLLTVGTGTLGIVIVVCCVCAIIYIIKALREPHMENTDHIEHIVDKEEVFKQEKRADSLFGITLDPRKKIRKSYRKKIKQYQKKIRLDSYQSCKDLQDAIYQETSENVDEISRLYEAVRYSECPVTEEMLKRAKKLAQKD